MDTVRKERIINKIESQDNEGPVIYWMSRDQRKEDNWALLYAQELAEKKKKGLVVCFCLTKRFLGATIRHYMFMLKGLEELDKNLREKNIPFIILEGPAPESLPEYLKEVNCSHLVTDFNPLRIKTRWDKKIEETIKKENIGCGFSVVDAHNIVPCWMASDKQEFAAYTIRPKINRKLDTYLEEFPKLKKQDAEVLKHHRKNDWNKIMESITVDDSVGEVDWIRPGEEEAKKALRHFLDKRLKTYSVNRNDPNRKGISDLSPYFHFGQLSPQRVALDVKKSGSYKPSVEAYLEELVVRRELSDNFCYYNENYDNSKGFPQWAKYTHEEHKDDERAYTYDKTELEKAKTHDKYWNAAQLEMIKTGKMHGYMRMYWAKKILEWTEDVDSALDIAIYLNDKYELDGRDPNGYVGVMWSIGGVHDRAWPERKVFGKIRYMAESGLKRKFDADSYATKYLEEDNDDGKQRQLVRKIID